MKGLIIMLHGLPCSGKSFLADRIAESFDDVVVLKTVDFRRVRGKGAGLFDENNPKTKEDKDESYKLLCSAARDAVLEGKIVVLDATFHKKYRREMVYDMAKELGVRLIVVSRVCSEHKILERLKDRHSKNGKDAFLKGEESYNVMKEQFEPILSDENVRVKVVGEDDLEGFISWLRSIL